MPTQRARFFLRQYIAYAALLSFLLPPVPAFALEWLLVDDPLNVEKQAPRTHAQFSKETPHLQNSPLSCEALAAEGRELGAPELVALALCNNPTTRLSWLGTLSEAATLGEAYGAYFPKVTGTVSASRTYTRTRNGGAFTDSEAASIGLSHVLFDFGKRDRTLEQALRNMVIRNYSHDTTLQSVILTTLQSYFQLLSQRAAVKSAEDAFAAAEATYGAATLRYELGLVPKGDQLQAESTYLQAKIALEQAKRQLEVVRGTLAESLGMAPNRDIRVAESPVSLDAAVLSESVDHMMELAKQRRPDLAGARLSVENARTALRSQELQDLPNVTLTTTRSYNGFDVHDRTSTGSIGVSMSIPLFTGFTRGYALRRAELGVASSEERLRQSELAAMREVWQAYHNYNDARDQTQTVRALVESAGQAHRVALGRYREGVGPILDVLSTLSQYTSARTQQQRTEFTLYTSGLQLMRAIGVLDADSLHETAQWGG